MGPKERSLDDMPLASYTTGVLPHGTSTPAAASATSGADAGAAADGVLAAGTVHSTAPGRALRGLPSWLTGRPRHLLDLRLLFGGMIVVGAILLVLSLLGGGGMAGESSATPSAPVVVAPPTWPPGEATLEITGPLETAYQLSGVTGIGPAVDGELASAWSDSLGTTLTLTGHASSVTRTTDGNLILGLTVTIDGLAVSFTSDAGECTIGMAAQSKSVSGSFVCKKLKSDNGKLTVDARGTYRT